MALAFLITTDTLQLLSERKVLKEAEYAAMLDANGVIAAAQEEAQQIRERAEEGCNIDRQQAWREGFEQGMADHASGLLSAEFENQRQLQGLRESMARLVARAVMQIVAETDVARVFESALSRVACLVRDERFVSVRVSPSHEPALRLALDNLREQQGWTLAVAVQSDATLRNGECTMHTGSGSVDLSVQAQIDAFEQALRRDVAASQETFADEPKVAR